MRIDGHWFVCDDGVLRPVIRLEVLASDHTLREFEFLVDTGADKTVLSGDALNKLDLPTIDSSIELSGLGGRAEMVAVDTELVFTADGNRPITVRGRYAAAKSLETIDLCILGRDILNRFALIVDRAGDTITLLGQRHRYSISAL